MPAASGNSRRGSPGPGAAWAIGHQNLRRIQVALPVELRDVFRFSVAVVDEPHESGIAIDGNDLEYSL